jgi:hypothetical protein
MKNKIKIARELLNEKYSQIPETKGNELLEMLKDLTEKAELSYNDVKIKRIRSKAALENMKKLEHDLELLLREVKN